jgi:hypothetical protein
MNRLGNAILTAALTPSRVLALFLSPRHLVMVEPLTKQDLVLALKTQTLRLSVRFGIMLAVAVAALATILKLA